MDRRTFLTAAAATTALATQAKANVQRPGLQIERPISPGESMKQNYRVWNESHITGQVARNHWNSKTEQGFIQFAAVPLVMENLFSMRRIIPIIPLDALDYDHKIRVCIKLATREFADLPVELTKVSTKSQPYNDRDTSFLDAYAESIALTILRSHIAFIMKKATAKPDKQQFEWDFAKATGDTIKQRFEDLYRVLVLMSYNIYENTNKEQVGENIVTTPEIASIFETATAGFKPVHSKEWSRTRLSRMKVGTINNRWCLYKDPLFPQGKLLMSSHTKAPYASNYYCPLIITDHPRDTTQGAHLMIPGGENAHALLTIKNFLI